MKYHLQPTQYKYFSLPTNPAGWNIIFQPSIEALMIFSPWRALQCLYFLIGKNMKTLQWRHYSQTNRWRHYKVFIFCYTWRNDLYLYNRLYNDISNNNENNNHNKDNNNSNSTSNSNKNNNVHLLGNCCRLKPLDFEFPPSTVICALCIAPSTNDTLGRHIKIHEPQMTTIPSKWTLLLYYNY